jgi:hypothetical protein
MEMFGPLSCLADMLCLRTRIGARPPQAAGCPEQRDGAFLSGQYGAGAC